MSVNHDKEDKVKIIFREQESDEETIVFSDEGISVLEAAKQNDVNIEGACNGGLACSTCHVYVEGEENFKKLEKASEEEEDMLDLAFDPKENSRLCCQLIITKEFENMRFTIPKNTCNIQ